MRNIPIQYDFRSDTTTRPSAGMMAAIAAADVGDDVFGDDPTVIALQDRAAAMTGKEAALYVSSGTQANLLALMAHCGRGDEYIAGQHAHLYRQEAGGGAVLGSIQPQPVPNQADGSLALEDIRAAIKDPGDNHFAFTRLLALENTFNGQVLSMDYMRAATALARDNNLATHLDGARGFNAAAVLGEPISALAALFDSVSLCLSKGLGAPVGSVLVGSSDFIARAHRMRKMLGGGMRQAGLLAAAGLYALEHNISRLPEDHQRAANLAGRLSAIPDLQVSTPQTNMIFLQLDPIEAESLLKACAERGVGLAGLYGKLRMVTHLDVDDAAIDAAVNCFEEWNENGR